MNSPLTKKEYINSGAFGDVYKVFTNDNKVFALKEFKNVCDEEGVRKEIDNLCKLQHPRIVRIYGSCFVNKFSMLMEYCPSILTKAIVDKITPNRAFRLFTEILEGMDFIHNQNMVHNDLKPDNILLDNNDSIKIGDFGLARQCYYSQWRDGSVQGAKMYLAPEALSSPAPIYSPKADMYAVGIILFQMYGNNCSSSLIQKLKSDPKGVACEMFSKINENIAPMQYEIVSQLLSECPEQRPSAGHLIRTFKESDHYPNQSNEMQRYEFQQGSGASDASYNYSSSEYGSSGYSSGTPQQSSSSWNSESQKELDELGLELVKLLNQLKASSSTSPPAKAPIPKPKRKPVQFYFSLRFN